MPRRTLLIATVLLLVCAPRSVRAQLPGQLSGTIADQTGAKLPGVRVTIRGVSNADAHSSGAGEFAFPDLPAGDYEVTAELSGFEGAHRIVRVPAGERVTVSLTLRVAIVEETIVTATKLGERSVQTIPMAVSAISSDDLERLGTQTVSGVAALTPSVTLSQNAGFGQLTIRGIGSSVLFAGSDPSSAMYLDGVYLARPAMEFMQLLDLDRIEVLRGPQGTLYGRNAVGGAMNLISKPPSNNFRASADLTVGNFSALRATALASGPLRRDRIFGSAAFTRGVRDGYVRDLEHRHHPLGGDDVTAARSQLRVVFDQRTNLLLSGDVDNQEGTPLTFNRVLAVKPGAQVNNPPDFHEVRSSALPSSRTQHYGASARLTTALTPSTSLVSLTAFRKLDYEFFVDADMTELNLVTTQQAEQQHQLSQEITVSHQQPGLTWVGGVFLFDESDHQSFWIDQVMPRVEVRLDPRVDATSRAVFGQATVGLTERLSAVAGLRYTHERKDIENAGGRFGLDAPYPALPGSPYGYADSITHSAWTPKIGLEMKLPSDAFAYVSATRGFKSGGFNPSSTEAGRGYAPEWVWSYEAGVKSAVMGGRSRFDVSAFTMDYTNLQVQALVAIGVFDIRNAATATIRGVEVENRSRIGHGIEAGGHLTWLDAVYDQYVAIDISGATADVMGHRLNNAPTWAGRFWIEWSGDIGRSRRLSIAADTTGQSTVFYTPFNDNIQRQDPYSLLGARITYGPSDRRWSVGAYVRNLTNTDYITAAFGNSPVAFGGRPGPSREFAVDFTLQR